MKVIVLGAGVVGIASAWYLAREGHEVTVVDRQAGVGLETSFANGGQISVSHAVPWANPQVPRQMLKWLGRSNAPLALHPHFSWAQWEWCARFGRECLPWRTRDNTAQILSLAKYSRSQLQALRAETGLQYDALCRGILHVYTDELDLDKAIPRIGFLAEHGCAMEAKTAAECVALEPALARAEGLVGGVYSPLDESGDACKFTQGLAERCREGGVRFLQETAVDGIEVESGRVAGVQVSSAAGGHRLVADAYVMALGSYSPLLLRPLDIRIPVYPVKGYSLTLDAEGADPSGFPAVSVTDEACKLVFSRLGSRLRAAGYAILDGYNTELDDGRCRAILARTEALFAGARGMEASARFWTGLRPATPGNVPYIGRSRYPNLFLNTGHGSLGWTLACGSGRALADIVGGRLPEVDFRFCPGQP